MDAWKTNLLGQNDKQSSEDTNKVNEEFHGMYHKVLIAHSAFFNDQLCVKQHKSTHKYKAKVEVGLKL